MGLRDQPRAARRPVRRRAAARRPRRTHAAVLVLGLLLAAAAGAAVLRRADPLPPVTAPPASPAAPAGPVCTVFASPSGDDAASGTEARPLRSAQALVDALRDGDTGCLLAGRYAQEEDVVLERPGVTLRSAPGHRATIALETLYVRESASDVTLSDLNLVGGDEDVTLRIIGDGATLARNDISNGNEGLSCVLLGSQEVAAEGATLLGNVVHHCGQPGSTLDHGVYAQNFRPRERGRPGLVIAHNAFYGNAAYAVQLYPDGVGAVVRDNVVDGRGATRGGIVIDGDVARDHLLERNVLTGTRTTAVEQRTGSGHVARDNCFVEVDGDVDGDAIAVTGSITTAESRYDDCLAVLRGPWRQVGGLRTGEDLLPR